MGCLLHDEMKMWLSMSCCANSLRVRSLSHVCFALCQTVHATLGWVHQVEKLLVPPFSCYPGGGIFRLPSSAHPMYLSSSVIAVELQADHFFLQALTWLADA